MKHAIWAVIAVSLLAAGSITTGQAPNPPRREFLSVLKPKQSILLKDIGGRFTVSLIDELPGLTHKVVEVGSDYIAVEDVSGLQQTRIPIWSITSITRIKTTKN